MRDARADKEHRMKDSQRELKVMERHGAHSRILQPVG